jgi:hypothetical protein
LRTCWLLLLEEYGVTFEYLPGKKNVATVVDTLPRLDIDSLKIQKESQKATRKFKETGFREKCLAQPHYSINNVEDYDLLCCDFSRQDLHYSIIETSTTEYCSGIMNIYVIRDRLEQKRLSGIP